MEVVDAAATGLVGTSSVTPHSEQRTRLPRTASGTDNTARQVNRGHSNVIGMTGSTFLGSGRNGQLTVFRIDDAAAALNAKGDKERTLRAPRVIKAWMGPDKIRQIRAAAGV